MKKRNSLLITVLLLTAVISLQNCKHDPAVTRSTADADTLYVGRPYIFAAIPPQRYYYRNIVSPADNPMTYEGVQLGRMLFYDSTLSLTHNISCGSCHKQQYSFGDNQKLSQNVLGSTVRNTPSLINLGMNQNIVTSQRFFWDGRQASIEDAVDDAFNHEMRPDFTYVISYLSNTPEYAYLFKKAFGRPGTVTETNVEKAIAQFLRTLISTNSRIDQSYRGEIHLTPQEDSGLVAFTDPELGDCFHCHSDGLYLTFVNEQVIFQNNGLDSEATFFTFPDPGYGPISGDYHNNGKFKIPTLRNVALSAPYMHDGRFATLGNVINHYSDSLKYSPSVDLANLQHVYQGGLHLDAVHKANLLAFLNALTDTSYIHNPAFSNPFH
jgi:cytochrome c peroxidase